LPRLGQCRALVMSNQKYCRILYAKALGGLLVISAYLDLPNYYHIVHDKAFLPKYAYFMLFFAGIPLFFWGRGKIRYYFTSAFSLWVLVLIFLNSIYFGWALIAGIDGYASVAASRIQFLLFSVLIGFIVYSVDRLYIARVCVVLGLVLSFMQAIDFFLPWTFSPLGTEGVVLGRASSTHLNANKAAEALILLYLVGCVALSRSRRVIYLIFLLLGVFLSFSRAGLFCWVLVLLGVLLLGMASRGSYWFLIVFAGLLSLFWVGLRDTLLSGLDPSAVENIFSRMMFVSTLDVSDSSSEERFEAAFRAYSIFADHPIFGGGVGISTLMNGFDSAPHNQHLLVLSEYGILGYVCYIIMAPIVMARGVFYREFRLRPAVYLAMIVFGVFSLFTHNMFDNLYWFVTVAIFAMPAQPGRVLLEGGVYRAVTPPEIQRSRK
jgi:hypothetical protein